MRRRFGRARRVILSLGMSSCLIGCAGATASVPTALPTQPVLVTAAPTMAPTQPATLTSTLDVVAATRTSTVPPPSSSAPPTSTMNNSPVTTTTRSVSPSPAATGSRAATSAPSGSLLYEADFSRWFAGEQNEPVGVRASYDPARREYSLGLTQPRQFGRSWRFAPEGGGFTDFRLDVDARRLSGPENGGSYGIVFRAQPQGAGDTTNARLSLFLYPEGAFALLYNDGADTLTTIAPVTPAPAIKPGEASNHLAVVCAGRNVTVIINGETLGTYAVPLAAAGAVGLVISQPRNATGPVAMAAAFSDLRISAVP